ncbi:hypothetical protein BR93DRAFT_933788 [Coniochaeta sp. PMI_546]|nr:hypothetical protein BR93DRAFT_933788 [Coniochaeta sp. PMI_546]
MKLLCLHGQGTSGAIFKSQTAAFRSKLGPDYTFDFVDAPFPGPPAPGIKVMYDSGTYTWWPQATTSLIRGSHQRLLDHISENGPYDALCCFSQGCSLAFSFLLYHSRENPSEPLPFKSVIFICGGIPFAVLEDLGYKVSPKAHGVNDQTVRVMKQKAANLAHMAANLDQIKHGIGLWDDTSDLIHDPAVMPEERDVFGIDFTTVPDDLRINIPTVHIYGAKDPRWPSSMQLAYFCTDRKMFDHGGGHDIPRSTSVSEKIAELIRGLPAGS